METMPRVDASKLGSETAAHPKLGKPIAVVRDGEIVGHYDPVIRKDTPENEETWRQLDAIIEEILATTGMTRDELADAFDLTKDVE